MILKLKHSALAVMLVTGVCASVPAMAEGQPAASASASAHPVASAAPVASGVFTPEQEAHIGEIAKDYLLDHPDVLWVFS